MMPTRKPPTMAPGMLPSPPRMVAANALSSRMKPTSGVIWVSGAISTAAKPARPALKPQVMV